MIFVVVGSDTYGRVKAVDKRPLSAPVFSMLQMLPFVPLKSYSFGARFRRKRLASASSLPFGRLSYISSCSV